MFVNGSIVQAYNTRYLFKMLNSILQIAIPLVLFLQAAYFIYVKISEQKTLERLLNALKVEENNVRKRQVLYSIGVYYDSNKDLGLAIHYYKKALKLNENLPQAFYNLGALYEILSAVASQKTILRQLEFYLRKLYSTLKGQLNQLLVDMSKQNSGFLDTLPCFSADPNRQIQYFWKLSYNKQSQ